MREIRIKKEEITAESLDENPWDFANNKKLASLADFTPGTFSGIPAFTNGPFAVNMEKVTIGKASELIEIELKALMSIEKNQRFLEPLKSKFIVKY